MKKNILKITTILSSCVFLYFIIRLFLVLKYNLTLEKEFLKEDYLKLITNNLGNFFAVILGFFVCINLFVILLKKGDVVSNFNSLYKFKTQISILIVSVLSSLFLWFIESSLWFVYMAIGIVLSILLIISLIINIVALPNHKNTKQI